jgi:hypothetical protein
LFTPYTLGVHGPTSGELDTYIEKCQKDDLVYTIGNPGDLTTFTFDHRSKVERYAEELDTETHEILNALRATVIEKGYLSIIENDSSLEDKNKYAVVLQ